MAEFDIGDSIVTVVVGIDGRVPPLDIQRDIEETVNNKVNKGAGFDMGRDSVTLTVDENPSDDERGMLGGATLYVMKLDVNLGDIDVDTEIVNATHNTVIEKIGSLGFNMTGTATVWDNNVQL